MVVFQKLEGKTTTLNFWNQKLEGKTTTLNFWNQKWEGKTTTPKKCVLTNFLHERSIIFFLVFSLMRFWILLRNEFLALFSLGFYVSLYKIKNSASEFRNTHIVSPQFKRNGKKPCQNVGSFYDIPEPVCYDLFNWFRCFFRFNCKKIVLRKSVLPFFIKSKGSRYRNPLKNQKGQKKIHKKRPS